MDRQKLRRLADRLPVAVAFYGLGMYVVEGLLGRQRRLAAVGILFVLALIASWVLRKVSGMTWREALWPRRAQLPSSMTSVAQLAQAGRKLEAMKMYRELTGADIKTGLEAVNAMIAQRALDEPATKFDPHL
ncbi:hypothetical protein AB0H43_26200 [Hamadaea sp. NPDC050747]|uniref:hypothetical protein n=1 Tax=Hamadaea sp. NPDC050747 TaxID=3155789 RepID=UPI0033EAD5F9